MPKQPSFYVKGRIIMRRNIDAADTEICTVSDGTDPVKICSLLNYAESSKNYSTLAD